MRWWIWVLIILLVLGGLGFVVYGMFFASSDIDRVLEERNIENPTLGKTTQQAVLEFDQSFVEYLLYSIGAGDLRKVPLTSNRPKVIIEIEGEVYYAYVKSGVVNFDVDIPRDEVDMILKTTKEEAVKMIKDKDYIKESFRTGLSEIEIVSGNAELFAKGYLKIYQTLTGEDLEAVEAELVK
jgi:uncharacterized protein YneF (UPF0154 family)